MFLRKLSRCRRFSWSIRLTLNQPNKVKQIKIVESDGGLQQAGIQDTKNCTIRALSISAGISYKQADKIGTLAGRERNKGFYSERLMKEATKHGITSTRKVFIPKISVKKFIEKYPKGRFMCVRRGHCFSIIDGVIYDNVITTTRHLVNCCYEVESKRVDLIKNSFSKC